MLDSFQNRDYNIYASPFLGHINVGASIMIKTTEKQARLNLITRYMKEKRNKQNLSQKEMAERLGVTQSAYSKWEGGKVIFKTRHLIKIAGVLNVTVDELLCIK